MVAVVQKNKKCLETQTILVGLVFVILESRDSLNSFRCCDVFGMIAQFKHISVGPRAKKYHCGSLNPSVVGLS